MADKKRNSLLSAQELAVFFASAAMLLRAGVPANEIPGIIAEDTGGGRMGAAAQKMEQLLFSGQEFALGAAMQAAGGFPAYAVEMVQLGEEAGRLEQALDSLGNYYRHQSELGQAVQAAVRGPFFLLVAMSAVLFFLVIFVLPVYESVFASLGVVGGVSLAGANVAARVAIVLACLLLFVFLGSLVAYAFPKGRAFLLRLVQAVPVTERVHYAASASSLTGGLQMLLASGIPAGAALQKAAALVADRRIVSRLPACQEAVEQGEDIGKAMVHSGVLTGFEAKILVSAARAGQTEAAMESLSAVYAEQANEGIDRLVGLIEPALVGLLSITLGSILLSVMLPLINIMSAIL